MLSASLAIKRSIKSAASLVDAGFGLPRPALDSVNIFAYHRVVRDIVKAEKESVYGIVISTSSFRKHCELLRRTYDVVSLQTASNLLTSGKEATRPTAVITFDDGYVDFYEEAFPVLRELGLPATVFLPTGYIGQDRPLPHDRIFWLLKLTIDKSIPIADTLRRAGVPHLVAEKFDKRVNLLKLTDLLVHLPNDLRERAITGLEGLLGDAFEDYPHEYRLLSWEMVREMSGHGISFGGHTANHVVLPLEEESSAKSEIYSCKETLEKKLGAKVLSFAYPNGEYNPAIRRLTAEAGFTTGVTTEKGGNGPGTDLLALGRTSLCEESTRGITGQYSAGIAVVRLGA
jgi:peptidoglycan/xylan/chitin deacetylase (PgdA/CDA1 family)